MSACHKCITILMHYNNETRGGYDTAVADNFTQGMLRSDC